MAVSIPGGATLRADGTTWQDANGKELSGAQVATIEGLHATRTAARNRAEAERLATEAQSNPIASALMALLGRGQPAAPAPPQPRQQTVADVVGQEYAEKLAAAGFDTPEQIARASDDDLLAIEGIGTATLKKLRAAQR